MDGLPTEILLIICKELDPADLHAFRLVNKTFAAVGSTYMFEEVIVFPHLHDLQRLLSIATHDIFRHNVREVFYRAHKLEEDAIRPYEQWLTDAQETVELRTKIGTLQKPAPRTKGEWRRAYEDYRITHATQSLMEETELDLVVFQIAFWKLPNMDSLTVDSDFIFEPRGDHHCPFSKCFGQTWSENLSSQRELLLVMEALCQSGKGLRTFQAGEFHWSLFTHSDLLHKFIETQQSSLTTLRLDMTNEIDDDGLTSEAEACAEFWKETSALSQFVGQFPKLQHLFIRWDTSRMRELEFEQFPARFHDVIPEGQVWPSLKTFTIGAVVAKESQLVEFFEAHKTTLQYVSLQTINLLEGDSWLRLLPKLQKMLTLEDAWIYGRLHAPGTSREELECWDILDGEAFPEDEFCAEVSKYMVEGGTCPLTEENMDFGDILW